MKEQELSDISINKNHNSPHRLSKISEDENESDSEKEISQISTQSQQLSIVSHEPDNNQLSQIVSLSRKNESSRSSTKELPLAVFNMRKL